MKLYSEYASIFKALSDETRIRIVEMLSCGELCACNILDSFNISQPTLSYHMKILTESGLIRFRKDGSWIRYSINLNNFLVARDFLDNITKHQQTCICKNIKCD